MAQKYHEQQPRIYMYIQYIVGLCVYRNISIKIAENVSRPITMKHTLTKCI